MSQPYDPQGQGYGQTQPVGQGSPTQPVPTYGQPAPAYGQQVQPRAGKPVEGWQPPQRPEVPFGPAFRWTVGINLVLGLVGGVAVYLLAALAIHTIATSLGFDEVFGRDTASGTWVWALVPALVVFVVVAVWGSVVSVIALGLLRLARGFRTMGAAGQGWLAWLIGTVGSWVLSSIASFSLNLSGDSVTRFLDR